MGADYKKAHRSQIFGATVGTVPPNLTVEICISGGEDQPPGLRARVYVSLACVLSQLRAHSSAAPGVGETFDYTLHVNGIATALTCLTIDPNVDSNDLVNQVAIAPGDYIEMEIVTSLNAAAAYHTWGLLVTA